MTGIRVATDVGGTFTDLVAIDPTTGELRDEKVSTTPENFAAGALDAVSAAGIRGVGVREFSHGSTIVINALVQRRGARTALVSTRGFRDVLAIGRGERTVLYDLRFRKQEPFVPRELRFEVSERIDGSGRIISPLADDEAEAVAGCLKAAGVEAVAVAFMNSYLNPSHESRCAEILGAHLDGVSITCSSELTREWKEYERTSTAVLNAYVSRIAGCYLQNLKAGARAGGISCPLRVVKSNGGLTDLGFASAFPIHLVESGPAAGVRGAALLGRRFGHERLITLDIGGTTAKTALVVGGEPTVTRDYRLESDEFNAGYPIRVPVTDIVEIGAGGGMIVWIDAAGALNLGPQGAGAVPGPACYDLGGAEPTVTDAQLVAGRLNPDYFLGGSISVSQERAREAIRGIATRLAVSEDDAALGIVRLADAKLVSAIKLVSVQRGFDPRDFAMVAFGGAGPEHAAAVARELKIPNVIIPPLPGHFSAWAMLATAEIRDAVVTTVIPHRESDDAEIASVLSELVRELDLEEPVWDLHFSAGMRYVGQEHTVEVPLSAEGETPLTRLERFAALHDQLYTFTLDAPAEYVTFHLSARRRADGRGSLPSLTTEKQTEGTASTRKVMFSGFGWIETEIWRRSSLRAGEAISGPAIIEEPAATTVLEPGQSLELDPHGSLVIATNPDP